MEAYVAIPKRVGLRLRSYQSAVLDAVPSAKLAKVLCVPVMHKAAQARYAIERECVTTEPCELIAGCLRVHRRPDATILAVDVHSPQLEEFLSRVSRGSSCPSELHIPLARLPGEVPEDVDGASLEGVTGRRITADRLVLRDEDRRVRLSFLGLRGLRLKAAGHCGANAPGGGGFQPGNTCASGGSRPKGVALRRMSDLRVDPDRFQYKIEGIGRDGVTGQYRDVEFNPELAGILYVWRDPEDGQDYIINGHHRYELAKRSGWDGEIPVQYIDRPTAEEARAFGAMINIASGHGTAIDAAKFLRDLGRVGEGGIEYLKSKNISLSGAVARDAVNLSNLSDQVFRDVVMGQIDEKHARAIGSELRITPDMTDAEKHAVWKAQNRLSGIVRKSRNRLSEAVVREMALNASLAPRASASGGQMSLFGDSPEEEILFEDRARVQAEVRRELSRDARAFGSVASRQREERLRASGVGDVDSGEAARLRDNALQFLDTFDREIRYRGELGARINDILNTAAVEHRDARGREKTAVRRRAAEKVRELLASAAVPGVGGGTGRDVPGSRADGRTGEGRSGDGGTEKRLKHRMDGRLPQAAWQAVYDRSMEWLDGRNVREARRTRDRLHKLFHELTWADPVLARLWSGDHDRRMHELQCVIKAAPGELPRDGDGDGLIYDGKPQERPAPSREEREAARRLLRADGAEDKAESEEESEAEPSVEWSQAKLDAAIDDWMRDNGIDPSGKWTRAKGYLELPDRRTIESIAAEQAAAKGLSPEAAESYRVFRENILSQYEAIKKAGLKVYAWEGEGEPYKADESRPWVPSSRRMREEVARTGEFHFFMTEKGFGSSGAGESDTHPLLEMSPATTSDGKPMLYNDVFRVTHDAVAHLYAGFSFSTRGEMNGMLAHATTLPKEAHAALFGETFAQNAVYEVTGKYAEQNTYVSKHLDLLEDLLSASNGGAETAKAMTVKGGVMNQTVSEDTSGYEEDGPIGAGRLRRQPGSRPGQPPVHPVNEQKNDDETDEADAAARKAIFDRIAKQGSE